MTKHKEMIKQETAESRHQGTRRFIVDHKRLLVVLSAAIVLTIVVLLLASMKTAGSAGMSKNISTFTVRRDDLTVTVTESGSIKARNAIDLKSEVEGQTTIISIVPEGTYITQEDVDNGKVLVELDSSTLEEQLSQREIDFASAEASYAEAKEAYDIQLKQNESDVTAAQLRVKFALMDFQKYLGETVAKKVIEHTNHASNPNIDIVSLLEDTNPLGGTASQKLKELEDNIILAESKFEQVSNTLAWTKKLYEKEYVAETKLREHQLDVQSGKIRKESAEIALKLFKLYDFSKETEKLLSDYEEAGRELDRTYARTRSRLAQADAKFKSAKSRFQLRKNRLKKLKKQIDACIIKAPSPGLVVYGSSGDPYRRRRGPIEEGESVYQRQTIISLPNTAEMIAKISVHESSVAKVRPGQSAKIIIEPFPDETFHGKVLKVAPLPDQQRSWLSPDLKVYATEVSIEGSHDSLKSEMSAKVTILVEQLFDVIIVPVQVVANREGKKVCYVATSRGPKQREVTTGAFNDTFVQIIDGLEVDEQVLLNPPRLIELDTVDRLNRRQKPQKPPQHKIKQSEDAASNKTAPDDEMKKKIEQYRKGMNKRAGNAGASKKP